MSEKIIKNVFIKQATSNKRVINVAKSQAKGKKGAAVKAQKEFYDYTYSHDSEKIFEEYIPLSEVFFNIGKEMITPTVYDSAKGGYMYASFNEGRRSGIMAIMPSLIVSFASYKKIEDTDKCKIVKEKLLEQIKAAVDKLLDEILVGGHDKKQTNIDQDVVCFDASPHSSTGFTPSIGGKSYIDSVVWGAFVFFQILQLRKGDKNAKAFVFDENYRNKAKQLIKWCIDYINNAVIKEEIGEGNIEARGWSFTKLDTSAPCSRSLYATYRVSELYQYITNEYYKDIFSMFKAFSKSDNEDSRANSFINTLDEKFYEDKKRLLELLEDAKRQVAYSDDEDEEEHFTKIIKALEFLIKNHGDSKIESLFYLNEGKPIWTEVVNADAYFNVGKELKKEVDEKSLGAFSKLKRSLIEVSHYNYTLVKDNLVEHLFYDDLEANSVGYDSVAKGVSQTNVLFNGLYHLLILLNTGYDQNLTEGDKKALQERSLLHTQKVQRYYNFLRESRREYIVETCILSFFTGLGFSAGDEELSVALRKKQIKVSSLTVLLIKANNRISEYLIKYPQKQMKESLSIINDSRFLDSKQRRWLFDEQNFHAIINHEFIQAIFEIYSYYEKYELPFVVRYEDFVDNLAKSERFTGNLRAYIEEKDDEFRLEKERHQKELKEKDKEIERAKSEAQRSKLGEELIEKYNQIIKDSSYFDSKDFALRIVEAVRGLLAAEFSKKLASYKHQNEKTIAELKKPISAADDSLTANMRALMADLFLSSAIEAQTGFSGDVELGKGEVKEKSSTVALTRGKELIEQDKINKLIASLFNEFRF